MPIRRKRKITSDPNAEFKELLFSQEVTRRVNAKIKDRGPLPIIPTLAGHCYACDYHEDEGHSPTCPVLIAEQIANAGPSLPILSDIPPMQGVYSVATLPHLPTIGQTYFRTSDATLWICGPAGYVAAGTI